ncbi:Arsenical pump membrane protein ArsB [Penicillium waksmanii]|uniref:Arsenical pump membrane protein ArsB n=1 Tax=Penicillium waksmanii TaxID=69791 RepID=UPI0025484341|nr:Arsenical pump membrane protein ArsB [Penicillium waksmanii]KAJ5980643.1 Arsenical pump membrane protein ArsB [Penicillium waksmanii]
MAENLDTEQIKDWRSIITLIIFVLTNIVVLFPFHIPFYIPRWLHNAVLDGLAALRIIRRREIPPKNNGKPSLLVRLNLPLNFVTAPLIADLFLLAILAIGRQEVHDGTVGADGISPIDILVFFLTLAYIAISIDASGLIRYLAFKVLQKGDGVGHRLFFYLYTFFFALGSFIGNDPIILSGTAFLAYMTRVSSNIVHPRAWIHSQFAVANIASAILVSSNPTNLVLAGAFNIKFLVYTVNMIVPVVVTAIVVFPFLLYIIFADESLIPRKPGANPPVNPNIPHARGGAEEEEEEGVNEENGTLLSLEEIMNPFLDKGGAAFGAIIMAATLITILAINAASNSGHDRPVFWVTLPAAFVMLCWDLGTGWIHRHETRRIAAVGRQQHEAVKAEREHRKSLRNSPEQNAQENIENRQPRTTDFFSKSLKITSQPDAIKITMDTRPSRDCDETSLPAPILGEKEPFPEVQSPSSVSKASGELDVTTQLEKAQSYVTNGIDSERRAGRGQEDSNQPTTLVSLCENAYVWLQETFPTVTVVLSHLPFPLVPFALAMFVLVQALVTKGWVPVFAYGWDHWVEKTGTVGAVGGMGFLSAILCNFAGTNIGTTILLSRVVQAWQEIHNVSGIPISDRTFWATVYSMALGVNFGAFSTAFSASLAGLLWRDILARKYIRVGSIEFARVNLPIIAIAMAVGCTVLIGEVYIMRKETPYDA